ncbi:NHRF3 protein, partial [Polypterus senegalus]
MDSSCKPRTINLNKGDGQSYGFFLRIEEGVQGHLIRNVEPGTIADKAGLKDGDRVVKVNGTCVDSKDHSKVVELIQESGPSVTLQVLDEKAYLKIKDQDNESQTPPPKPAQIMNGMAGTTPKPKLCYMVKDKSGYGFSLKTVKNDSGIFMTDVKASGVAEKAGVKNDDRLIEINNENVEKCTHEQAVAKVKQAGNSVVFLLVDEETYNYYKNAGMKITNEMANLKLLPHKPRTIELAKGEDGYGYYLREEKARPEDRRTGRGTIHPPGHERAAALVCIEATGSELRSSSLLGPVATARGCPDGYRAMDCSTSATPGEWCRNRNQAHPKCFRVPMQHFHHTRKCYRKVITEHMEHIRVHYKRGCLTPFEESGDRGQSLRERSGGGRRRRKERKRKKRTVNFIGDLCIVRRFMQEQKLNVFDFLDLGVLCLSVIQAGSSQHVVKGSPAEQSGLVDDDILVEVNGVNVEKKSHEEVVEMIRSAGSKIEMLLAEKTVYNYFTEKNIPITTALIESPNTETCSNSAAWKEVHTEVITEIKAEKAASAPAVAEKKEAEPGPDPAPTNNSPAETRKRVKFFCKLLQSYRIIPFKK